MNIRGQELSNTQNLSLTSLPSEEETVKLSTWTAQDLSSLYVKYRPQLERHARKFLNSQTQVDDVVQDAFLYLLVTLPELDSELGVLRFLKWKTRLLALDLIRGNSRVTLVPIEDHENLVFESDDMSKNLERLEDAAIVRLALSKLNENHRNALIMNVFQEKTIDEMSEFFMLKPNATRQLLLRAQRAFKVALVGNADTSNMSNAQVLSVAFRKAAEAAAKSGSKVGIFILAIVVSVVGLNSFRSTSGTMSNPRPLANSTQPNQQVFTEQSPSPEQNLPEATKGSDGYAAAASEPEAFTSAQKPSQQPSEAVQGSIQESLNKYVDGLASLDELSFSAASVEEKAKLIQFSNQNLLTGTFEVYVHETVKISNFKALLFTTEKAVELEAGLSKTTQIQNQDGSITATYVGTITRLEDGNLEMPLREVEIIADIDPVSKQISNLNVKIK